MYSLTSGDHDLSVNSGDAGLPSASAMLSIYQEAKEWKEQFRNKTCLIHCLYVVKTLAKLFLKQKHVFCLHSSPTDHYKMELIS